MKKKLLITAMLLSVVTAANSEAGEVERKDIADEGRTVTKHGLTYSPHVELEYGNFSDDTNIHSDSDSDIGIALGLTVGINSNNLVDVYTRQSLGDSGTNLSNFGLNYAYMLSKSYGYGARSYFAIGLESENYEKVGRSSLTGNVREETWDSNETRLKLGFGYGNLDVANLLMGKKVSKFTYGAGGGIILGIQDVDTGRYGDTVRTGSSYFEGSDSLLKTGFFVQGKFGYYLTPRLKLHGGVVFSGETSLDDLEIGGHSFTYSGDVQAYLRGGLQYSF